MLFTVSIEDVIMLFSVLLELVWAFLRRNLTEGLSLIREGLCPFPHLHHHIIIIVIIIIIIVIIVINIGTTELLMRC